MNSRLVSGVTGAAPIWHAIMAHLLKNRETNWPEPPADIAKAAVCWTGIPNQGEENVYDENGNLVSTNGCGESKTDYYWKQANPTRSTLRHQGIQICQETGLPPNLNQSSHDEPAPNCTTSDGEYLIAQDPLLDFYCVDCPRPVDENGKTLREKPYLVLASDYARQYGD